MNPTIFFILFWRLAVNVLFPHCYMDTSLEDALANEQLVWSMGSRTERQLLIMSREAFRTILMMVLFMEIFQGLDAALALNMPAAANRRRRL